MKKLVFLLAVAFSVSMFSCGGSEKAAEAADTVDSAAVVETVVEEAVVADSVAADSVAPAAEEAPAAE